jgi:hypothetical protein
MDKRTALQKAKLDLIAENQYIDPFYWAPIILVGDTHGIKIAKSRGFPLSILLVSLFGLLLLLYFARNRWIKKYGETRKPRIHESAVK